jgi:hypothetical protein
MDQQPPAQTPPPQSQWTPPPQSQWTPPPQQPMGWGGPGYGGPPPRPTGVTLAAIYLIVMGVLTSLLGGCVALIAGSVGSAADQQIPGLGAFLAFGAAIGVVVAIIGVLGIISGAGALGGASWARWLGIVVSVLFVIFGVLGVVGGLGSMNDPQSGGVTGLAFSLVITIGYALSAYALIAAGNYFSYRR